MTGLPTRIPPPQQFRRLMLRVLCGTPSFRDDVTPFAYQVLVDRIVVFSSRAVCHGRPAFMAINNQVGPLSGSVEPGSDPVTDQQVDDGRETVIEDDAQPLRVHRENVLCPPGQPARRAPHEFDEHIRAVRVEQEQQDPQTQQTRRDVGDRADGDGRAPCAVRWPDADAAESGPGSAALRMPGIREPGRCFSQGYPI
ncbi:hypothetical protein ACFXC9_33010 [Streptomyces naganishii]|uniref:hypothetical protein n=1 Tax=Streptomyces naganishii TaxID=285447 RepID=UPI0036CC874E